MNAKKHAVPEELLSGLLADYKKPEDLIGENGLLKQLTKLLVEKALDAELSEHLGHGKNEPVANEAGNTRNSKSQQSAEGQVWRLANRGACGSARHLRQPRWTGLGDEILSSMQEALWFGKRPHNLMHYTHFSSKILRRQPSLSAEFVF